MVIKLAFGCNYAFRALESFQVGFSEVGDVPQVRLGDLAEKSYLFGMIGPHFDYCQFRILRKPEERQRYANVVVQVALCGKGTIFFGKTGIDKFFGCGFSIATG